MKGLLDREMFSQDFIKTSNRSLNKIKGLGKFNEDNEVMKNHQNTIDRLDIVESMKNSRLLDYEECVLKFDDFVKKKY